MDDLVEKALARWPNVPAIAGWLKLNLQGDWLLTGDTGMRDDRGYFRYVGRADDVITTAAVDHWRARSCRWSPATAHQSEPATHAQTPPG